MQIKTSEQNKEYIKHLSNRLEFSSENIIARIALAYSLSKNTFLDLEKDLKDSKGKEYKEDVLFGKYQNLYIALICQHYGLNKKNTDKIAKYIKMHIDHGIEAIYQIWQDSKSNFFNFLIEQICDSIETLSIVSQASFHKPILFNEETKSNRIPYKEPFASPIKLYVGNSIQGEEVFFHINDIQLHSNSHIAIAGQSGSGKTRFALKLLEQISMKTNNKVNFLFLDFKGLSEEDERNNQSFFQNTKTTLIKALYRPFPINPLSFIDTINEKNKKIGISKFVDILSIYNDLGKIQQQTLKNAIMEAFQNPHQYPTLKNIYDIVLSKENGKPSKLTDILQSLSEIELFIEQNDQSNNIFNSNYYLSLGGNLSKNIRFTAVFLIINYVYNMFMNMENAPIVDNYQSMRYVIAIDEAHTIFKEKKNKELLEVILREIRSKGVSVILISQGIEEFNQPSFDFSSMCENAFLFDIKDKTNPKPLLKFLGLSDNDSNNLRSSMENIKKFQMISNLKEIKAAELINVL